MADPASIAAIVGAVSSVVSIFNQPSAPPKPKTAPVPDDAAAKAAREREQQRKYGMMGAEGTDLSSGGTLG